jgi:transposase
MPLDTASDVDENAVMSSPLEAEIVRLNAALAESEARFEELLQIAARQSQELSELRAMLRRKVTGERPPPTSESAPADPEGDTAAPGTAPPAADEPVDPLAAIRPPRNPNKKPRSKGTGRRPLPTGLPEVALHCTVGACEHCGSKRLLARDTEPGVRLDAIETIARLRREVLDVVRCKDCGRTTTATPPLPCPRSKFTCGFLAWLVYTRFVLLVPINRIYHHLRRQNLGVPRSSLIRLIEIGSDLAGAVDGVHWRELKQRRCILTDATGVKVLIEGLPHAWHAIFDVFNGDETAVFTFALTKHGDELASLLKGFKGVVMCDAESRLNELCAGVGVVRANCNAHPRREFRDAEKTQPVLAKVAGRFLTRMYAVERKAAAEGLVGTDLLERRQTQTRPIVDAFRTWLDVHQPDLLPSDPLGKVVRYYIKHFDDLTRFVDDPDIPIDNNPSERAFQDLARMRYNSLFAGSPEGGHRWAVLLGIVTTAKRHGLDIQAYLTWMFERRGTARSSYGLEPPDLTPAAYKKMLEKQRADVAA